MRRSLPLLIVGLCLLLAGCAHPYSTGALWSYDEFRQTLRGYGVSDAERHQAAHAYELALADEALASERARLRRQLDACPGTEPRPLEFSVGDAVRDGIRIWARDDANRVQTVAQLALVDWWIRRGQSTGNAVYCDSARTTLAGSSSSSDARQAAVVIGSLGTATVARDPRRLGSIDDGQPFAVSVSDYALGYVDAVRAAAPLARYLSVVYGGSLLDAPAPALPAGQSPETMVDGLAPASPDWEPDALYVTFKGTCACYRHPDAAARFGLRQLRPT
jgi:hypothetical protein